MLCLMQMLWVMSPWDFGRQLQDAGPVGQIGKGWKVTLKLIKLMLPWTSLWICLIQA